MKKAFSFLLCICTLLLCLSVGCDSVSQTVTSNDEFSLDYICVDSSSLNADGKVSVLLFFEVFAKENIGYTPIGHMDLIIDDIKYSTVYSEGDYKDIFPSYTYSLSYVTVEAGSSKKFLATYSIPSENLNGGKKITIGSFTPNTSEISFSTDDIQYFDSLEQLLETVDYSGYSAYQADQILRESADEATVKKVTKALTVNGDWAEWVLDSGASYIFYKNGTVEGPMDLTGTYTITQGYVICDFGWTKAEFKYEFDYNGEFIMNSTK